MSLNDDSDEFKSNPITFLKNPDVDKSKILTSDTDAPPFCEKNGVSFNGTSFFTLLF